MALNSTTLLPAVSVERISYHGWPDCYLLSNGLVEAVVVPAIGRVMQLRLKGDEVGAFWENRELDGQLPQASTVEWMNFGGDKCWPAPQTDWPRHQGREWPPPVAFDSLPVEAVATERGVTLTSPIDPDYGIQVVRHVELEAGQPVLRIQSEYRKLRGEADRVAMWTITQLRDPERVFILLREESNFATGYLRLMDVEPKELRIEGRLLSLARHPRQSAKIGTDGVSLAWVGEKCIVRIDFEQGEEQGPGEYPDGGCPTEIYTNADPLKYVELEALGALTTMHVGDRIELTTVYTVTPRSTPDLESAVFPDVLAKNSQIQ